MANLKDLLTKNGSEKLLTQEESLIKLEYNNNLMIGAIKNMYYKFYLCLE